MQKQLLSLGDITIKPDRQTAYFKGRMLDLRRKEYELLEFMIRNKDRVLNKLTILEYVWHYNANTNSKTLEVHIAGLRKKLKECKKNYSIKTVHGFGYMLCDSNN